MNSRNLKHNISGRNFQRMYKTWFTLPWDCGHESHMHMQSLLYGQWSGTVSNTGQKVRKSSTWLILLILTSILLADNLTHAPHFDFALLAGNLLEKIPKYNSPARRWTLALRSECTVIHCRLLQQSLTWTCCDLEHRRVKTSQHWFEFKTTCAYSLNFEAAMECFHWDQCTVQESEFFKYYFQTKDFDSHFRSCGRKWHQHRAVLFLNTNSSGFLLLSVRFITQN